MQKDCLYHDYEPKQLKCPAHGPAAPVVYFQKIGQEHLTGMQKKHIVACDATWTGQHERMKHAHVFWQATLKGLPNASSSRNCFIKLSILSCL